jgi:CDP-glucose 4,6-dehydratase
MHQFSCFKNKIVLISGHTGFKGSWLSIWLTHLGAKVVGLSSSVPTKPAHFSVAEIGERIDDNRIDICDTEAVNRLVQQKQPDFVFHLAAQALVRTSYADPIQTMMTNAMGSANLLDALRTLSKPVVAVMITSDKAYDNVEWVWGYRETDTLGGKDPYSASKGMAELAIRTFVDSFFNLPDTSVRVGITRAGNVIGGGDWAQDRIVPDCMKAWAQKQTVDIRSPDATRPWQHVLEPLSGYLVLAKYLSESNRSHGEAYNFGPQAQQNYSVRQLIDEMAKYWDQINWNDVSQSQQHQHEAGLLKLNCDKALFDLAWQPTLQFHETVRLTVDWYKQFYQHPNESIFELSMAQIKEYSQLSQQRGMPWAQ